LKLSGFLILIILITIQFVLTNSIYAQATSWEENQLDGSQHKFYIGGLTKNSLEFADIDGDNDYDCFVTTNALDNINSLYENVVYFENVGDSLSPVWELISTAYLDNDIPSLFGLKVRFVDIDSDCDLDMFIGGVSIPPLLYYKNIGSKYSPEWELVPGFLSNLEEDEMTKYCYPAFVDIDGDDDYDLIYGNYYGDDIYYENVGDKYNCDFIKKQTEYFGSSNLGHCNNLEFYDIDGDSDFDALIGRDYSLLYMQNIGTIDSAIWQVNTTNYLGSNWLADFYSPSFADLDNNDTSELFFGTENGIIWTYNDTANHWIKYDDLYFDDGSYLNPEFADLDGDGNQELIIPMYDFHKDSSFIKIYTNIGNADSIVWDISNIVIQVEYPYPLNRVTFADIDADGDLDMIAGFQDFNLDIILFKNTGDLYTPVFQEEYEVIATFQEEELIQFFPVLVDYDNDHDLDIIVSAQDGTTNSWEWVDFFTNTGDSIYYHWEYSYTQKLGYGAICCYDDDLDGDLDMMFSFWNHITLVKNIGNKWDPIFQPPHIEKIEIPDQWLWGIALTDLNNDGKEDLIIGTEYGGMYRYDNMGIVYNVNSIDKEVMTIYPNPAHSDLFISGIEFNKGKYCVSLFNSTGKFLEEFKLTKTHFSVSGYAPGIYLYSISLDGKTIKSGKFIIK